MLAVTVWADWCLIRWGTKTLVRRLSFFPLAGFLALMLTALMPAAVGQSGSFEIAQSGHAVGTASFQFTATKEGFDSTSLVKVAMQGLDYALSKTEQLSSANQMEHVLLSATVNGEAVNVVAAPDSAQLLLNISANGKSSTTRLAAHPGAILPKNAGSIEPVQLATYADQEGTLDGKPIPVHHMVATIAGAQTELFSGPENQLLQAELLEEGFTLIREGFQLKPPAKPVAPLGGVEGTPPAPASQ